MKLNVVIKIVRKIRVLILSKKAHPVQLQCHILFKLHICKIGMKFNEQELKIDQVSARL